MLYGIPRKSVLVFFVFTEVVVHVLNLTVSHNASIPATTESKNLRVLYRFYKPENLDFVYVASVNSIRQFSVDKLHLVAERITGPHNFSIYCLSNGDSCEKCMHVDRSSFPFGYGSDFCLPHPTNNYVKAWGTSGFPGPEIYSFNYSEWDHESHFVNDDRITFEDSLYVCNTVFHGYCERLGLINVSQESPWSIGTRNPLVDKKNKNPQEIPVVGSLPYTHSVLVVGSEYIYVGTEPDGLQEHTLITFDPLTVRLKNFHLCSTQPSFESRAQLSTNPSLRIQYKSAFRYRSLPNNLNFQDQLFRPAYVYFVLQQPESSSFFRWQSRIARVCDGDKFISSYVELNIACFECVFEDDEKMFNALHFSSHGTVGKQLARELLENFQSQYDDNLYSKIDITTTDHSEVLIVAFASQPIDPLYYWSTRNVSPDIDLPNVQYNPDSSYRHGSILLPGSAISLFSMTQINAKFDRVVMNCLDGIGMHGPSHFLHSGSSGNPRCVKDDYSRDLIHDCPSSRQLNQFITGNDPDDDIYSPALLYFKSNVTGMAITTVSQEFTVAIFTTDDGYLYKYELLGLRKVHLLGSLQLVPNGQPITSLALDHTGTIAFATSFQKVFRIELFNCSAYLTCQSCLKARDPYCGWCIAEGRCLLFHQCPLVMSRVKTPNDLKKKRSPNRFAGSEYSASDRVFWLHYNTSVNKCPVIRQVSPPGIQISTTPMVTYAKENSQYYQQNIILSLDAFLSQNLPNSDLSEESFSRNQPHQINSFVDSGNPHHPSLDRSSTATNSQLFCSFREAPTSVLQMESLISGTLSNFDLNKILLNVTRTPLLTRTVAKLFYSSGKPIEAHCLSPAIASRLPQLEDDKASVPLLLWLEKVRTTDVDPDNVGALAPALFAVYNCSQLKDCQSCTRSRFVCAWCLFEDQCVPVFPTLSSDGQITNTVCKDSSHLYSKSYEQINPPFDIIPPGHADDCPSFKGSPKRITLTSGSSLTVNLYVSNVQKQQIVGFSCAENCTNQHVRASFNPSNSTVFCHMEVMNLTEHLSTRLLNNNDIQRSHDTAVICDLDLYWHGLNSHDAKGHRMVNVDQVQVEVYACEWLAEYCDKCLDLPPRFGCSWCVSAQENIHINDYENKNILNEGKCRTQNSCVTRKYFNGSIAVRQHSIRPGDVCPDPEILTLSPTNATLTGQPILTITGRNLGRSASDIVEVFLDLQSKIQCIVLSETYQRSHKFMCKLVAAPHLSLPVSGKLKVVISNKRYEAFSPVFHFAVPHLIHATPQRGPKAGGTRLYLSGTNLNIGRQRAVYLYLPTISGTSDESYQDRFSESDVQVKCEIEQESETLIVCLTTPLLKETMNTMKNKKQFKRHSLFVNSYYNDNNKTLITPETTTIAEDEHHIPLSLVIMHDMTLTYLSHSFSFIYTPNPSILEVQRQNVLVGGGTTVRVLGSFLFVVQDPRLVFYFSGSEYSMSCLVSSNGQLDCLSPSLGMFQDTPFVKDMNDKHIYTSEKLDNLMQSSTSVWTNGKESVTSCLPISQPLVLSQLKSNREFYSSAFTSHPPDWPTDVPYGFIMDGVHQLRIFGLIKVYQDPIVIPFPDGIRVENLDDDYLTDDLMNDQHVELNTYQRQISNQSLEPSSQSVSSTNSHTLSNHIDYSNVRQLIRIHGHFDALINAPELAKSDELIVRIGDSLICEVNSIILTEIRCDLDRKMILKHQDYPVEVQFGRFLIYRPGSVRFVALRQAALRSQIIMIFIGLLLILIFVCLIGLIIWRRFMQHQRNYQAKLDEKYAEHENRVVRIFKEDFMELQTSMQEFSQEVKKHNLPYRDYKTFCLFSLFPEYHCELMNPIDPHLSVPLLTKTDMTIKSLDSAIVPPHPLLSPFTVHVRAHDDATKGISLFHALLCNRQFLYLLIHLIEEDKYIMAKDKSRIASLLCAALQPKMDYLTSIMFDLMTDFLYQLRLQGDTRLATAFRRAETIVDKILSNWLTFLLYNFIKNSVGENLFYFYRALLQQINMGPRDAITGKARYTLDSSSLLQTEMTGKQITLCVEDPQQLFGLPTSYISVKVLDCDTITQAKEKILDGIYKNKPYSKQIKSTQLELKRLDEQRVIAQNPENELFIGQTLSDWDVKIRSNPSNSTDHDKLPVRLNCIADYHLKDNAHVSLVTCEFTKSNHSQSISNGLRPNAFQPQPTVTQNSCFSVDEFVHTPPMSRPLPPISSSGTTMSFKNNTDQIMTIINPTLNAHISSDQLHMPKFSTPSDEPFCFRPVGTPDPKLWYHLEWKGNHNDNIMDASGTIKKSTKRLDKRSDNLDRLLCICTHNVHDSHVNNCLCNKGDVSTRDLNKNKVTKMCSGCTTRHPLLSPSEVNSLKNHATLLSVNKSKRFKKWKKHHNRLNYKRDTSELSVFKGEKNALMPSETSKSLDHLMETLPKEVFFNRLLLTRLSVTKYMDKLFEVMFSSVVQSHSLPAPIKYLFDFLDDKAIKLGVHDSKIIHAWKSNCIQMRFWNQFITNLDYIFDVPLLRNTALERSFHAFSHAMTYACAPNKEKITKDSSCVKLLFAPDISQQWNRVHNYYREIKALPTVEQETMNSLLRQHSQNHSTDFNVSWAVFELYTKYVRNYQDMLIAHLQQDAITRSYGNHKISEQNPFEKSFTSTNTEWNPVQIIQILIEIKRCLDNVQTIQTSNNDKYHHYHHQNTMHPNVNSFSPSSKIVGDISVPYGSTTAIFRPSGATTTTNVDVGNFSQLSSAPSQTATDCLDTLRSYNTLTTEFAALSTNDTYADSISKYKDPLT
ncbi:putative plexin [Schistosoma mansoni]|uniref:putative plexin n=1 Tax=Schistosoma mansoni TaxID=6183 RepID=UPI00022DC042|nr:putative plexin [Schistosoma mansoni]|eukprot:XP_018651958.1 putative plexin [Schistosoma mansoni]